MGEGKPDVDIRSEKNQIRREDGAPVSDTIASLLGLPNHTSLLEPPVRLRAPTPKREAPAQEPPPNPKVKPNWVLEREKLTGETFVFNPKRKNWEPKNE